VLILLCLVTLLSYYDRFLIGILVEDLRAELHISDGSIGLLSGFAFAIVYSVMAVPIAAWSDGGRRVPTLTISLLIWSAMTGICGLATGFTGLLLARLGVALGEAGGVPTTHALVSEHFSERWRGTALSAIVVTSGLGVMAATGLGGWVSAHWGWRAAFWVGAAPGPLLALLLWITVRSRKGATVPDRTVPGYSFSAALRMLARRQSFVLLCTGVGISSAAAYASMSWAPAILMRGFGLGSAQVGPAYGVATGIATVAGLAIGGLASDRLARRDTRWRLWVLALGYALAFPLTAAFLFAGDFDGAVLWAAPMTLFAVMGTGPGYALVQALAGTRARATAAAVYLLAVNLIGMGVGPSLAGLLSDWMAASAGSHALRDAMLFVSFAYLLGAILIVLAGRRLAADMEDARQT